MVSSHVLSPCVPFWGEGEGESEVMSTANFQRVLQEPISQATEHVTHTFEGRLRWLNQHGRHSPSCALLFVLICTLTKKGKVLVGVNFAMGKSFCVG
jgi:hypothetical protein